MNKYTKLQPDIIVPKVWLQSYNKDYLDYEIRRVIAAHYLNLSNFPTFIRRGLIPAATLVIVEEKNYFLLEEEMVTFLVPDSELNKQRESQRHHREHQWMEIPTKDHSRISTNFELQRTFSASTVCFIN